jgi:DNA-binding LacI/PurR family transcriptional regulator
MQKIVKALEHAILDGQYLPHCRLPSERELTKRFRVPVRAARAAVDVLEERGLIYRIERGGTFVKDISGQTTAATGKASLKCINFIEPVRSQTDPFAFALANYLHGYTRVLQNRSLRVQFVSLSAGDNGYEKILNPALPVEGQGCIVGDLLARGLMEWLRERNIPYVIRRFSFYDARLLPEHHGVYLNRNGASFNAVKYLIELGHSRIGYIGQLQDNMGPSGWGLEWCCCYDGYQSAFSVAGRQANPDHRAHVTGGSVEEAAVTATTMLNRAGRPTAIVCQNDLTAFGVIRAARAMGMNVPDDLSVIGFDNDPAGAGSDPPLTTFGGHEELAVAAIEKLLEVAGDINHSFGAHPVECPMIMRKSTARPPDA